VLLHVLYAAAHVFAEASSAFTPAAEPVLAPPAECHQVRQPAARLQHTSGARFTPASMR
jgi:hypothetical protein